ncbi:MAG: hypothetical protein WDN45_12500 [Caulobacteraceae bacterium]
MRLEPGDILFVGAQRQDIEPLGAFAQRRRGRRRAAGPGPAQGKTAALLPHIQSEGGVKVPGDVQIGQGDAQTHEGMRRRKRQLRRSRHNPF